MELLLLDNYDSFTYNIAHIFYNEPDVNLRIIKSDKLVNDQLDTFDAIIFSPGPDIPRQGNKMEQILECYDKKIPILGICLGLQAIVKYYGGTIYRLEEVVHGRKKLIKVVSETSVLFNGLNTEFEAGLYHSWLASKETFPEVLEVTALSEEGRIMAVRHRKYNIEAVQFHPESIMTPLGTEMIYKWLKHIKK